MQSCSQFCSKGSDHQNFLHSRRTLLLFYLLIVTLWCHKPPLCSECSSHHGHRWRKSASREPPYRYIFSWSASEPLHAILNETEKKTSFLKLCMFPWTFPVGITQPKPIFIIQSITTGSLNQMRKPQCKVKHILLALNAGKRAGATARNNCFCFFLTGQIRARDLEANHWK